MKKLATESFCRIRDEDIWGVSSVHSVFWTWTCNLKKASKGTV